MNKLHTDTFNETGSENIARLFSKNTRFIRGFPGNGKILKLA